MNLFLISGSLYLRLSEGNDLGVTGPDAGEGRRGKIVYSISTQGGEIVRTSPPVCYACSSAISFIFWGTVRMGFFAKYADEYRDFVCRKHDILIEKFLETESLAKRCNNDIWAQIEEIPSFW